MPDYIIEANVQGVVQSTVEAANKEEARDKFASLIEFGLDVEVVSYNITDISREDD